MQKNTQDLEKITQNRVKTTQNKKFSQFDLKIYYNTKNTQKIKKKHPKPHENYYFVAISMLLNASFFRKHQET